MTDDSVPVYGNGQVEAAVQLGALADGDRIWVLIDGRPLRWHRVEAISVEPILGQTRFQAWIVGRDRGSVCPIPRASHVHRRRDHVATDATTSQPSDASRNTTAVTTGLTAYGIGGRRHNRAARIGARGV